MRSGVFVLGTALILLHSVVFNNAALEMRQRRLSPTFTVTLVHNDVKAMMSHVDALNFCRGLGKPKADAEIGYDLHETASNHTTTSTTTTAPANTKSTTESDKTTKTNTDTQQEIDDIEHTIVEADGTRYRSDLLSIHDGHMVNELMRWVLKTDKRQFWIGGVVKLVEHNIAEYPTLHHLLQLWTDRTPANFRFLHYDTPMMHHMRPNDVACVSIDYASGKWGLHDCNTRMFFVCETVELSKVPVVGKDAAKKVAKKIVEKASVTMAPTTDVHTTHIHLPTTAEHHTTEAAHTTVGTTHASTVAKNHL